MSRAFTRESDDPEPPPERAISTHPNLVTARGLAAIEAQIRVLEGERQAARAAADTALRARIERDLRYWTARRASARVVPKVEAPDRVRFGVQATLQSAGGAQQTFRLVGEDEADAAHGLLSWVSPLAQALLGHAVGDSVPFQGAETEIVGLEP
ncbi:MAG: GreA/GreB family elongation factor [Steroidobacteraceae bacterium]